MSCSSSSDNEPMTQSSSHNMFTHSPFSTNSLTVDTNNLTIDEIIADIGSPRSGDFNINLETMGWDGIHDFLAQNLDYTQFPMEPDLEKAYEAAIASLERAFAQQACTDQNEESLDPNQPSLSQGLPTISAESMTIHERQDSMDEELKELEKRMDEWILQMKELTH